MRKLWFILSLSLATGCGKSPEPKAIWCEPGKTRDPLIYPRAIAQSPIDHTFFIVDRSAHVQHWDQSGKLLNDWYMPQKDHGKPVGLSVGPDGNLYVPDTHYHRLIVYSPNGQELRRWGSEGTAPGQFIYLTDVAFDSSGNLYVSEYGDNDRIQVFDLKGNYIRQFGHFGIGDGEFSRPQSMVIDHDTMYVTDACNHRIAVFKLDGTWIRNMGSPGSAPGQFRFPYGLDMDRDGNLIVCEFGNNRVQKIDKQTGKGLQTWGSPGHDPGQLAYPWAVVVNDSDEIVTVDSGNNRVQVFKF